MSSKCARVCSQERGLSLRGLNARQRVAMDPQLLTMRWKVCSGPASRWLASCRSTVYSQLRWHSTRRTSVRTTSPVVVCGVRSLCA